MVPAARAMAWLHARFGVQRLRVFEPQSAHYVSSSYWLGNRKSLATGFTYRYADVREGLKDTIAWMRAEGWLDDRRRLFALGSHRDHELADDLAIEQRRDRLAAALERIAPARSCGRSLPLAQPAEQLDHVVPQPCRARAARSRPRTRRRSTRP